MSFLSDAIGEGEFTLPITLSEEEIQERQAQYFENRRKIEIEDRRLADAKALHKEQIDPVQKLNKSLYQQITEGVIYKTVRALEVVDEDKGAVSYCDPQTGEELYSRPMTPSEKQQYRIKFGRRRATAE